MITDQQKGSVEATAAVIPDAVNFFCSYHRQKNILTQVKGGKGEYSAHWYYQLLLGCGPIESIDRNRFDVASSMDVNSLQQGCHKALRKVMSFICTKGHLPLLLSL